MKKLTYKEANRLKTKESRRMVDCMKLASAQFDSFVNGFCEKKNIIAGDNGSCGVDPTDI